MHVKDARAFQQLEKVYGAINGCSGFAAEFHLEEMEQSVQASIMQLPGGQRISDLLTKKKFERYQKVLEKSVGLDLIHFDRMIPFVVVNFATESLLQQDMPEPLDQHLWGIAKMAGKSLHGIETFQEQMAVLQKITLDDQLKMLSGLCRNIARFRRYLLRIAELYELSEVQKLYKMVKKNSKGTRSLMIYRRNEIMAERIGQLVHEQSLFAAIGAAHLGGGKGVLRLLKQQGIQITPIKF